MKYSKVKDHNGLVRNTETNAIISTNMSEYNSYKNAMSVKKQEKERIENIENKVEILQNDISEIKNLLLKIINN
jgi:hypothetical protein